MKIAYKVILVFLVCIGLQSCNEDQVGVTGTGEVKGRVVEAKTFEPIENAKVTLTPTNNATFTDENGDFTILEVPVGDYSVQAEKDKYLAKVEAATVTKDNAVNVIFEMEDETALNKPPAIPVVISPEDQSTGHPVEVELLWFAAADPDDDELTYDISIRNDYDDKIINVESLTDTVYNLTDLRYGTKYFWQLTVSDDINNEVVSPVMSFQTTKFPENRFYYVRKDETNHNNIIFSSDREGTTELQLTLEDQNSWRPRMNHGAGRIAYLRTVNTETHLFTMNLDGSDSKQVTSAVAVDGFNQNQVDFAWSSNGDRLIYPSYDKLYLINKDGSGLEQIYQTPDGSFITEMDWSNDESFIALKTNNLNGYNVSIFTINMAGTKLKTLLSGVPGAAGGLNISVDNQRVLFTRDVSGFEDPSFRQLDSRIFIYDLVTDVVTDLSEQKLAGTNDLDARFSPNEAYVIFVNTSNDGISQRDVYIADAIGDDRQIVFENVLMPDWE